MKPYINQSSLCRLKSYVIIAVVLLSFASCHDNSRYEQALSRAESLICQNPDSALIMLNELKAETGKVSESFNMRCQIDIADACNKAYIPLTSDTVLKDAVEYYDRYGSDNEQMKAHYLLGCAYRDQGKAPQALQCFHDAVSKADIAEADCDRRLLMIIHGQISDVFESQCMPAYQLMELDKARKIALTVHDSASYMIYSNSKASAYYAMNRKDLAVTTGLKVYRDYMKIKKYNMAYFSLATVIPIYLERGKFREVKPLLAGYHCVMTSMANKTTDVQKAACCIYLGDYYRGVGLASSADSCYRKSLSLCSNINNKVMAYNGLYRLYKNINPDSTQKFMMLYCQNNDSSVYELSTHELSRMQAQYDYSSFQKDAAEKEVINERLKSIMLIVSLGSGIVFILAFLLYRNYRTREKEHIHNMNITYTACLFEYSKVKAELELARRKYAGQKSVIKEKTDEVNKLKEKLESLRGWKSLSADNSKEERIQETPVVAAFHKLASTGIHPEDQEWGELRKTMNSLLPGFSGWLVEHGNTLTLRETDICILVKLHFLPSEVSVLTDSSPSSVSNARCRLLYKLFDIK